MLPHIAELHSLHAVFSQSQSALLLHLCATYSVFQPRSGEWQLAAAVLHQSSRRFLYEKPREKTAMLYPTAPAVVLPRLRQSYALPRRTTPVSGHATQHHCKNDVATLLREIVGDPRAVRAGRIRNARVSGTVTSAAALLFGQLSAHDALCRPPVFLLP